MNVTFINILLLFFVCLIILIISRRLIYKILQLGKTNKAFNLFMKTTPEYFAVIDDNGRIEHISDSLAKRLGLSGSQYAKNRAFMDICKNDIMPAVYEAIELGGTTKKLFKITMDGKLTYLMLRSFPINKNMSRTFEFTDVTRIIETKTMSPDKDSASASAEKPKEENDLSAEVVAEEKVEKDTRKKIKLGAFKTKDVKVLVVDDNPVNLTVAEEMLRKYDIDVVTAVDGKVCVDKIQQEEFDAVFMDYMMPVMDGIEATQAIRALGGRHAKIPIVAVTANAVFGAEKMFLDAGMDYFIAKPIAVKDLHNTLLKIIPQKKLLL